MIRNIRTIRTCRDTHERLTEGEPLVPIAGAIGQTRSILVDSKQQFQPCLGFGGAFTESSAVTWKKMSPASQEEVLQAYFSRTDGIGYQIGRVHINSCDFSLGNWACCDIDGDTALESFTIDRYHEAILPMAKRAFEIAGEPLTIFISPWSPPAWMKDTKKMNRGGKLLPEYREAWALYYARFIQALDAAGVPVWGLTVQNEPAATQSWDSCVYTAEEEKDFVRDHLGPTLEREGLGHIKIIIWDHNRDEMVTRAKAAYDDPEASKYIWGTGFHWYCDERFDNVRIHKETWPDKHLLFTEGCQEGGPHIGEWALGERYARNILRDLNNGTEGWTDWNLVLDETGGPNHVGNFCSAPILCDTQNDKVLYQNSFYYMGHFSKFIRPGAVRVLSTSMFDALEVTAFRNPDGSVATVVLNRSEEPKKFALSIDGVETLTEMPQRSIATFILEK